MNFKRIALPALCVLLLAALSYAPQETQLLRFPSASADSVVFTYAGDLYTAPLAGGVARKLTSNEGYEAFARFSPDGRSIAFTGEYDGNREVYVIPAEGGEPRRVTYTPSLGRDDISDRMGPNNIVMGWTPDGSRVVFRSRMAEWNDFNGQLYFVDKDGGLPEQLPLPRGGFCSLSPDGRKLAYNRIFREFRTWKRYRGGMADDIWVYDFETKKVENITNNPALDIIPMWRGERIYFLSDRDEARRMNLYVYDIPSKATRKLTDFKDFDIKFPSLGPTSIVFENGGFIHRFDLASEKTERVPIIISDDRIWGRGGVVKVADRVTSYEISPDGKRALFGARGDVFTVPAQYGNTRNLTATSGVHERSAVWSPDGRSLAFISDKSGEDEVYIMPQDGSSAPVQLTKGADTYKYRLAWSPDSKKILWNDKEQRLCFVDVESKEQTVVVRADRWEIDDFAWSPDSRWVAYVKPEIDSMNKIYLYSLESRKHFEVTDGWFNSAAPAFSPDGKYLFFVSDRDFNPIYSSTEWDHAYLSMSRVYLVTLGKDVKSPFEPRSDEVGVEKEPARAAAGAKPEPPKKPEAPKPAAEAGKPASIKVDPEGIKDRIAALPVATANYWHLGVVDDSVYYLRRKDMERETTLALFDLKELKEKELGKVSGYEISADGKKMLVAKERNFHIIDLPKGPLSLEQPLNLSSLEVTLDRRAEWDQIFDECWRQMKYFFYAPNMHGLDWEAVRTKYKALAAAAGHRADLTYVIGEMIGELSAGHTYVGGGDMPRPKKVAVGMLGAKFERDPKTGFFRISRILKGQNWDPALRSPLTEVGVNVKEGEYVIAVDGRRLDRVKNIYETLVNTVGRQVRLTVNSLPQEKGSREVTVVPVETENALYYLSWVEANLEKVSKATGGQVGYIHIPNMGSEGLNEFVKRFYPQLRKKGLIVDVRGNGGGNVSPMIIDRLIREMVMVEIARNSVPVPDPGAAFLGPKVALCDEFSASDGDIFPYRFKSLGLGKLIGKRTWGGVVGIRGSLPLLDGGFLNKPEFAPYAKDGREWIIEGRGVEPDIVVDNDPAREYAGVDDQLNKAIEVILEEIKTKGKQLPPPPPFPKKAN